MSARHIVAAEFDIVELIKRIAPRRDRRPIRVRPIAPKLAWEAELERMITAHLQGIAVAARETALIEYEHWRRLTRDDPRWFERTSLLVGEYQLKADGAVRSIVSRVFRRHTDEWAAAVKSATSVDIASVLRDETLEQVAEDAAAAAAALVKRNYGELNTKLQFLTLEAKRAGKTVRELASEWAEAFGVEKRRGRNLARDQISKVTADLNRARQEQAGIDSYEWLTSADESVRPRHRALNHKLYKWGEPTGAEEGLPPGKPINCRCVAGAIILA